MKKCSGYFFPCLFDISLMCVEEYEEEVTEMYESNDYFMDLLCFINNNFFQHWPLLHKGQCSVSHDACGRGTHFENV